MYRSKTICTVQNIFGPIEGKGIRRLQIQNCNFLLNGNLIVFKFFFCFKLKQKKNVKETIVKWTVPVLVLQIMPNCASWQYSWMNYLDSALDLWAWLIPMQSCSNLWLRHLKREIGPNMCLLIGVISSNLASPGSRFLP